jgi:plasmid maintenance system antidote protein VapI
MYDSTTFQPDWFSKPGDTLLALMEERELSAEALADLIGCRPSVVRGLLAGTASIDDDLADRLARHVGGTSSFWLARQSKYVAALARVAKAVPEGIGSEWVKQFPHRDVVNHGWMDRSIERNKLMAAYLAYFGVSSPSEWADRYASFSKGTAFRTSPTFKSKVGAISTWLRQGEIQASTLHCGRWTPDNLRRRLQELRVLTKAKSPSYFLPRLRKICADCGVAVVFVRAPSGCSASGATRFISANKAMVILSFRYLSDDHFWFTFFHELGHLLLHSEKLTFVDGEPGMTDEAEAEANSFSADVLIPSNRSEEMMDLRPRRDPIIRFAYSVGVAPGIVVGQLQHKQLLRRSQLNFLKRRFDWDQISAASN